MDQCFKYLLPCHIKLQLSLDFVEIFEKNLLIYLTMRYNNIINNVTIMKFVLYPITLANKVSGKAIGKRNGL